MFAVELHGPSSFERSQSCKHTVQHSVQVVFICKKWNASCKGLSLCEVEDGLLMGQRVLLTPQYSKQRGPFTLEILRSCHFGMAGKTQRDHQLGVAIPRLTVVNRNRSLSALEAVAAGNRTPIAITGQHGFPVPPKVFFILPLQRVAGCT